MVPTPFRFRAGETSFSGTYTPTEIDATEHNRFDDMLRHLDYFMTWFIKFATPSQGSDFTIYKSHAKFRLEWPVGALTTWSWARSRSAILTLTQKIRRPIQDHIYPLIMNMDSESNRSPPSLRLIVKEIPQRLLEFQTLSLGPRAQLRITHYGFEMVSLGDMRVAMERSMFAVGSVGRFYTQDSVSEVQSAYLRVKGECPVEVTLLVYAIRSLQQELTDRGPSKSVAFEAILESEGSTACTVLSGGPINIRRPAAS